MMSTYDVILSRRYKTSFKRLSRHKDFNLDTLERVVGALARGDKLAAKHRDHQLSGELKEYRECHIGNDMLLMYQRHEKVLVLLLVDLGSHDALFR